MSLKNQRFFSGMRLILRYRQYIRDAQQFYMIVSQQTIEKQSYISWRYNI